MRRRGIILTSLVVLITTYAAMWAYQHKHRERLFYKHAFSQMEKGGDSVPMITLAMDDGGSAKVILEHACCSGAGFNAVAVRTSDGEEYTSKKNYCGLQGFDHSVTRDDLKNLASFKAFLADQGCSLRQD